MKRIVITLLSALLVVSMSVTPSMAAGEIDIPGGEVVEITSVIFPDEIFRNWVASTAVDVDQDQWLDQSEIDAVTAVTNQYSGFERSQQYVLPNGIENLTGLEVFTNIQNIIFDIVSIGNNQYSSINIANLDLTKFTELEILYLRNEKRKSEQWLRVDKIDISQNTKLRGIRIEGVGITSLDINSTYVDELSIDSTNIEQIDLSGLTKLKYFWAEDSKLKSWAGTNATSNVIEKLSIGGHDFLDTTIDVSKYSALKSLTIRNCNVESIEGLDNCTKLEQIDCSKTKIEALGLSGLNKLSSIVCQSTLIEELDLSSKKYLETLIFGGAISSIKGLEDCTLLNRVEVLGCKLDSLDLRGYKYLEQFVLMGQTEYKEVKSLNLSECLNLTDLSVENSTIETLDFSNTGVEIPNLINNEIGKVKCDNCNLYYLDVDETTTLEGLASNYDIVYEGSNRIGLDKNKTSNYVGLIDNNLRTYTFDPNATTVSYDYTVKTGVVMHVTVNINGNILTEIAIDESHFPDSLFRQYVSRYDTDNDGKLSLSERQNVYSIGSVGGVNSLDTGTQSIEGIEYFPNLQNIVVDNTSVTRLDVSKNKKLTHLYARETGLSRIDVSENILLDELRLSDSKVSELNLSNNSKIKYLELSNTPIRNIDVSKCIRLIWINLYGSTEIGELDLTNNLSLESFSLPDSLLALDLPDEFVEFKSSEYGEDDLKTTILMTLEKNQTSLDLKDYAPHIDASRITKVEGSPILTGTVISNITNGSTLEYKYSANKTFDLDVTIRFEVPGDTNPGQGQGGRTTTDPIVEPGGGVSVNISNSAVATTDNGKTYTTTTLNDNQVTDIIKAAENSNSDEVIINASTNNNTDVAEVVVPTEFFKRVDNKLGASVSIQTDTGTVTLDPETVKSIAKDAKGGNVQLAIEKTGDDYKVTYNISISAGGKELHTFNGGGLEITVTLPKKLATKNVSAVYTDSDGNVGPVAGTTNSDGTYTFTTNHLSSYSVISDDEANRLMKSTAKKYLKGVKLKVTAKTKNKHKTVVNAKISSKSSKVKKLTKLGYKTKYKYYRSQNNKKYTLSATKSANKYTYTKNSKGKAYYYKTKLVICDTEGNAIASTSLANCKPAKKKY